MGRKSKNKKQLTITLPEDLPPPVLTKEVDTPKDSRSPTPSPSLSPTGSVSSSTSSLLSIGPPPYVKHPKKLGASKSAVESFVASSTAALHEEFGASAWDFPIPEAVVAKPAKKNVGKVKAAPKSLKGASTSEAVPVAGTSKKACSPNLPKLSPAVCTPIEATAASKKSDVTGASASKSTGKAKEKPTLGRASSKTPVASVSKKVPVSTPSPASQHPDTSKKSSVTRKSKAKTNRRPVIEPEPEMQVPTPSKKIIAADLQKEGQDVDSDASSGTLMPDLSCEPGPSHAMVTNKRQLVADSSIEIPVPGTSEQFRFRSLAGDMDPFSFGSDANENPKKKVAGTSKTSFMEDVPVDSSSSSSSPVEPSFLDMLPGEVPGFAEVGNGNMQTENFSLVTDNLLESIDDEDEAFQSLVQEDLADFPTINQWIQKNGGATGAEAAANSDPMMMDEVIRLQTELESLRSSLCTRVEYLLREQARIRPVPASTPRVRDDPAPSTSVSAQAANSNNTGRNGVQEPAEAGASPASTSFTDASQMGTSRKENESTGKRKRKVCRNFGGRKGKPRSNTQKEKAPLDSVGGEDTSEKFWMHMDKFIRDITEVDVENVESLSTEHRNLPEELFEIPALGKHYKGGDGDAKSRRSQRKQQKQKPGDGKDVVGPATEQLVKAMVKERVENFRVTRAMAAAGEAKQQPREETRSDRLRKLQQIVKTIRLEGAATLEGQPSMEARIKGCMKELKEILADDEDGNLPLCDPEDEILSEIYRTQIALREVHGDNERIFAYLKRTAMRELERSKWSRLVDEVDRKLKKIVMESNFFESQKLPKEYQELTTQTLRERKRALHMLEIYDQLAKKEEGFIAAIELENSKPKPRRPDAKAAGAAETAV